MCFPIAKQIISLCTKTMETSVKMFLNINHASSVGEKSTETRQLTSDVQHATQCTSTTILHFEYYTTVMHLV